MKHDEVGRIMTSAAGRALVEALEEHVADFGPHKNCDGSTVIQDLYEAGYKIIKARKRADR